ncbi:hypothetical protein B4Q13_19005, partial [Lacticaseibacillus rhamnosus]
MRRAQRPDGSFEGSWAVCFTYGTWFAMSAFEALGIGPSDPAVQRAMQFLLGKQLPYIAVAMVNFFILLLMAIFIFKVPLKGSFPMLAIGALERAAPPAEPFAPPRASAHVCIVADEPIAAETIRALAALGFTSARHTTPVLGPAVVI